LKPEPSAAADPLEALAEDFVRRLRAGERPPITEYTERHPQLAERIRGLFPTLIMLEQAGSEPGARKSALTRPMLIGEAGTEIRLGDFRIVREVGRGGMGIVYEAVQESLGRRVALKVLARGTATDSVFLERFRREARSAARLHHTNIVPVFGVGESDGVHYYAMQFIQGQGLDAVLADVRRLRGEGDTAPPTYTAGTGIAWSLVLGEFPDREPEETARDGAPAVAAAPEPNDAARASISNLPLAPYFRSVADLGLQAAEALAYAHAQRVLHRDVKPSNLLLDARGTLWVADFGLSKFEGCDELTRTGDIVGTIRYMAPERFGGRADARSDVYALGATLYELLTLRPAFQEVERIRLIAQVTNESPQPPCRLDPRIPHDLETIVLKAMAPEAGARYSSATSMAEDLRCFLDNRPIQARRATLVERFVRLIRRNPYGTSVVAALVVTLIATAGSVGWIASERKAREAALTAEVDRAVDEAGHLIVSAKWSEAVARVQRAREVLYAAGCRQLPERLEQVDHDLTAAQRLEEIYLQPRTHDFFSGKEQDSRYADAFKQYGIDVAVLPVIEASRRIRERSIRAQLVLALDLWADMRYRAGTPTEDWQRLFEISQAADDDPWRCQLRDICRRADRRSDREAVAALVAAADLTQMPPASLYLLARVCHDYLQDAQKALAVLRHAQQQYPGDLWLNDTLGSAYMEARPPQYDEAICYYSVALALRPNNPYLLCRLGEARLGKGAYPDAIATLSRAIELKPDFVSALWSRGNAYLKAGAAERALADASRVVDLLPESAAARRDRGSVYDYLKQWTMSVADYSAALKLDAGDSWSWHHRGYARLQLRDWDGALADLSEALRLDAKWSFIWTQRGEVFVERQQWAMARADFEKALELSPDDAMIWFVNICLCLQCADGEGYRKLSRRMEDRFGQSKIFGEIAILAHVRALAAPAGSESTRVRELARRRMELSDAINPDPYFRALSTHILGLAYYRTGEYDKAVALLEQAVHGSGSWCDVSNYLVLAMAHNRLSHATEGRKWLAKAGRLIDEEDHLAPEGGFTPPRRIWWDWLCVQMLRREAEALLGNRENASRGK
jgi:serine/threonine protein kinase/regulator of sirC expression with transglutaminase-like and TPR domain